MTSLPLNLSSHVFQTECFAVEAVPAEYRCFFTSAKNGKIHLYAIGQVEPEVEVLSPGKWCTSMAVVDNQLHSCGVGANSIVRWKVRDCYSRGRFVIHTHCRPRSPS